MLVIVTTAATLAAAFVMRMGMRRAVSMSVCVIVFMLMVVIATIGLAAAFVMRMGMRMRVLMLVVVITAIGFAAAFSVLVRMLSAVCVSMGMGMLGVSHS